VKIWLIAFTVVAFGLTACSGQPVDPADVEEEGCIPFEGGALMEQGRGPVGSAGLPGRPGRMRGATGRRRPKKRGFRENFKAVKAEFDLLKREIDENTRKLRDLREQLSSARDGLEEARIKNEMRRIVEKLSQYEILLAEKKVEVSKKAMDRALDRYTRSEVELEQARRRSRHRLKWLEKRSEEETSPCRDAPR